MLLPIFWSASQNLPEGLTGFRAVNAAWALDGDDLSTPTSAVTTAISRPAAAAAIRVSHRHVACESPRKPAGDGRREPSSPPQRNLLRGWRLGLPSGQDVARAMGVTPIADADILIGQGGRRSRDPAAHDRQRLAGVRGSCPLWTYILAEAMQHREAAKIPVVENVSANTPRLGPVGGRIVAEGPLGLIFGDRNSLLNLDPFGNPQPGPISRSRISSASHSVDR